MQTMANRRGLSAYILARMKSRRAPEEHSRRQHAIKSRSSRIASSKRDRMCGPKTCSAYSVCATISKGIKTNINEHAILRRCQGEKLWRRISHLYVFCNINWKTRIIYTRISIMHVGCWNIINAEKPLPKHLRTWHHFSADRFIRSVRGAKSDHVQNRSVYK